MDKPIVLINDISYSLRRFYVDEFFLHQIDSIKPGCLVLDLGGNKIQKRGCFNIGSYPVKTLYANLNSEKCPDVQCDAMMIPFQENRFDIVICAELLEHVYNPYQVIWEVHRVLKPGGYLLATTPFLFHIHGDPDDYGRYTDHYWFRVLEETGFSTAQVEKQGTYYSVLSDFVKQYTIRHQYEKGILPWLLKRIWRPFQEYSIKREARISSESFPEFISSYTTGFGIKARK